MKNKKLHLVVFFSLCLSLLSFAQPLPVGANEGKTKWDYWHQVTRIVDGDTVRALVDGKEESIRIIGINAPEANWTECFGAEATAKAKEFLEGKWIQLEKDDSQGTRDKYGRQLAYVWFDTGTDFGRRMIEEGYAFEYTYNKPYNKQSQYKETQDQSKTNKLGLWKTNTCSGNIRASIPVVRPAPAPAPRPTPSPPATSSGVVKKSRTGICHAPGTTYYSRTTNYTPYPSVRSCLNSGGRLPLR